MTKDQKAPTQDKSQADQKPLAKLTKDGRPVPKRPNSPRQSDPLPILNKSNIDSPCLYLWDLADKLTADGQAPDRHLILKTAINDGVATATAKTQYGLWLTYYKANNDL